MSKFKLKWLTISGMMMVLSIAGFVWASTDGGEIGIFLWFLNLCFNTFFMLKVATDDV